MRLDPAVLEVRVNFADTPEMRKNMATYCAVIESVDWDMGRLMQCVQSQRLTYLD